MKVIRYSHHGFKPLYQSYYQKQINYLLFEHASAYSKAELAKLTPWAAKLILDTVDKNKKLINPDFNMIGIHVFFDSVSSKDIDFFLNHLSEYPPKHEMDIPDDTIAFGLNETYLGKPKSVAWLKSKEECGCYIPYVGNQNEFS